MPTRSRAAAFISDAVTSSMPVLFSTNGDDQTQKPLLPSSNTDPSAMAPTTGSPSTWTFRFKLHKSTTLLHVDPLQSFDSIKTELLRALHETHADGHVEGTRIPSDSSDVILARPNDIHDASLGWTRIDDAQDDGAKSQSTKKKQASDTSPKAVGLKDNAVLAFKFRTEDDEGLGMEEEEWDVILPSYEDNAGTTNEGDVGGAMV